MGHILCLCNVQCELPWSEEHVAGLCRALYAHARLPSELLSMVTSLAFMLAENCKDLDTAALGIRLFLCFNAPCVSVCCHLVSLIQH